MSFAVLFAILSEIPFSIMFATLLYMLSAILIPILVAIMIRISFLNIGMDMYQKIHTDPRIYCFPSHSDVSQRIRKKSLTPVKNWSWYVQCCSPAAEISGSIISHFGIGSHHILHWALFQTFRYYSWIMGKTAHSTAHKNLVDEPVIKCWHITETMTVIKRLVKMEINAPRSS